MKKKQTRFQNDNHAFVALSDETKALLERFIFNKNEDKASDNLNVLLHLFKKDKMSHLKLMVNYLNSVSEIGGLDNSHLTRFGYLFSQEKRLETWIDLMRHVALIKPTHTDSVEYFFKNCTLNIDSKRLMNIVGSADYTPKHYSLPQNTAMLLSLDQEIKNKIESWVNDKSTSNLSLECRSAMDGFWDFQINNKPGYADFVKAKKEMISQSNVLKDEIKNQSEKDKIKTLKNLMTTMVALIESPELAQKWSEDSFIYFNSWVFNLQDLTREDKNLLIKVMDEEVRVEFDMKHFIINALSGLSWKVHEIHHHHMYNDHMPSIAVAYPALKEVPHIMEANLALVEKELLSHQMSGREISSPQTAHYKI